MNNKGLGLLISIAALFLLAFKAALVFSTAFFKPLVVVVKWFQKLLACSKALRAMLLARAHSFFKRAITLSKVDSVELTSLDGKASTDTTNSTSSVICIDSKPICITRDNSGEIS